MHLIDKHCFPKDYDFCVVNDGIDRRSSMLKSGRHRRGSSAALQTEKARRRASTSENLDVAENREDTKHDRAEDRGGEGGAVKSESERIEDDMEGLVGSMSALKFVPPSVRFGRGRGKGRGGFSRP